MKTLVFLLVFVVAASLNGATTSSPAKPATPTKAPPKEVYELPKTGVNQPRPSGGWINAEAVGIRFVLKFYDKDKKPAAPDVDRGFAQFRYSSKNPERAPLSREGETLVTPAKLRPPHNFLVLLSLFAGESADPVESYNFKYP